MECLKTSEEIKCNSYDHSETFSSVRRNISKIVKFLIIWLNVIIPIYSQAILLQNIATTCLVSKPALTNRQKEIQAIIRSSGVFVNVRLMV